LTISTTYITNIIHTLSIWYIGTVKASRAITATNIAKIKSTAREGNQSHSTGREKIFTDTIVIKTPREVQKIQ